MIIRIPNHSPPSLRAIPPPPAGHSVMVDWWALGCLTFEVPVHAFGPSVAREPTDERKSHDRPYLCKMKINWIRTMTHNSQHNVSAKVLILVHNSVMRDQLASFFPLRASHNCIRVFLQGGKRGGVMFFFRREFEVCESLLVSGFFCERHSLDTDLRNPSCLVQAPFPKM